MVSSAEQPSSPEAYFWAYKEDEAPSYGCKAEYPQAHVPEALQSQSHDITATACLKRWRGGSRCYGGSDMIERESS